MPSKSYPISPAKIGSQDGFRLPKAFSHDHSHFVTAKGHIEMISENTFLVHLEPDRSLESDLDEVQYLTVWSISSFLKDRRKRQTA